LSSADRNGFSAPYCKFSLYGQEVFKSNVLKKMLHTAWNESLEEAGATIFEGG
jgi:Ca2+-dependent lipid-binding protein